MTPCPEPITPADREKAKELCAKATPGPWCYESVGTQSNEYAVGVAWRVDDETFTQLAGEIESCDEHGGLLTYVEGVCFAEEYTRSTDGDLRSNVEFIAFARTAIPAYEARVVELEAALQSAEAQLDALILFKGYVHNRLDDAGIPAYPDGKHSKEGCRVGDRLDIALASEARATALLEALRGLYDMAGSAWFADDGTDSQDERDAMFAARAAIAKHGAPNDRQ